MQNAKRTTRQHRSGNSYSVRLPRDMAYPDPEQELEIEARGDERVIRPKRVAVPEMTPWPKPTMTPEKYFAWLDARGGSKITDDALVRGIGRPNPWDQI